GVDRTAAGIQHDGRAAELSPTGECIKIPWTVGSHDPGRADPAPAIRLAIDPSEFHRQFAFFEGDAGMSRTAQHSHQCNAKAGADEQHPPPDICPTSAIRGSTRDAGALRGFDSRDCRQVDQERDGKQVHWYHEHDCVTSTGYRMGFAVPRRRTYTGDG